MRVWLYASDAASLAVFGFVFLPGTPILDNVVFNTLSDLIGMIPCPVRGFSRRLPAVVLPDCKISRKIYDALRR